MKNIVSLLVILFALDSASAQQMRFTEGVFDNGLTYPIAEIYDKESAKDTLNANIMKIVSVYKDQDYCISRYGYVQHNEIIQLNFYFNCIDLDESKTELHLFNLANGEKCLPSDMFSRDEEKKYSDIFRKKIAAHFSEHGKDAPDKEFMNNLSIDDCTVVLKKAGLEIALDSQENWPSEKLLIAWAELRPYMEHLNKK